MLRISVQSLKSSGISYVVLPSSCKVTDPPSPDNNKKGFFGAFHAKVETVLQESGITPRSEYFNSNLFRGRDDVKEDQVELLHPNAVFGYVALADTVVFCGMILAELRLRQKAGQSMYLCGPKLLRQRETRGVIAKTLGRDIKIKEIDGQT